MKKYIWISGLFLLSCGSRKVAKQYERETAKEKTEATTETKSETTTDISDKTLLDIFENNMNFGIKPIGDVPAKFVFIHNGQKIEGETTGELNFRKEESRVKKVTETVTKINTTYQTETTYKTQTTYKHVYKDKQSESTRSEFAWYILSALLGAIAIIGIQLLWKSYGGGITDRFRNGKIKF